MADITAQQLADAIAYAVSEDMEPDEPARTTVRGELENFTVRGEFNLELVAAALNRMRETKRSVERTKPSLTLTFERKREYQLYLIS